MSTKLKLAAVAQLMLILGLANSGDALSYSSCIGPPGEDQALDCQEEVTGSEPWHWTVDGFICEGGVWSRFYDREGDAWSETAAWSLANEHGSNCEGGPF